MFVLSTPFAIGPSKRHAPNQVSKHSGRAKCVHNETNSTSYLIGVVCDGISLVVIYIMLIYFQIKNAKSVPVWPYSSYQ